MNAAEMIQRLMDVAETDKIKIRRHTIEDAWVVTIPSVLLEEQSPPTCGMCEKPESFGLRKYRDMRLCYVCHAKQTEAVTPFSICESCTTQCAAPLWKIKGRFGTEFDFCNACVEAFDLAREAWGLSAKEWFELAGVTRVCDACSEVTSARKPHCSNCANDTRREKSPFEPGPRGGCAFCDDDSETCVYQVGTGAVSYSCTACKEDYLEFAGEGGSSFAEFREHLREVHGEVKNPFAKGGIVKSPPALGDGLCGLHIPPSIDAPELFVKAPVDIQITVSNNLDKEVGHPLKDGATQKRMLEIVQRNSEPDAPPFMIELAQEALEKIGPVSSGYVSEFPYGSFPPIDTGRTRSSLVSDAEPVCDCNLHLGHVEECPWTAWKKGRN